MFHCLNWHTLKLFVISYIAFAAINIAWFCFIMKDFYREKLAAVMSMPEMGMGMGMFSNTHLLIYLAWALVVAGIIIFVLPRTHGIMSYALVKGALYGLYLGGAHQLLNYALVPNWPLEVVYYDIAWMMVVCALVTAIAVYAAEMCGCEHMCSCNCSVNGSGKSKGK